MRQRFKAAVSLMLALVMLFTQVPVLRHAGAQAEELQRGVFHYASMYGGETDSVLDYAYSDAYFAGDARVYNPSLSTMSLCFEMSSWR